MTDVTNKREAAIKTISNVANLLTKLGYIIGSDGKISRNQYRDLDAKQVALDINTHLLTDDDLPFYDVPIISNAIEKMVADVVKKNDDKLFDDLKHNPAITISDDELKKYLSLYFQWDNETDYMYFKASFLHWLLSVKRRFYNHKENNPLCLIFTGGAGDGKSFLLRDICGLIGNASLDVKHFEELFKDNRGFKVWTNRFILAVHEMGEISEKMRETFKDCIDARYGSGREMHANNFSKIEMVASLIGATNLPPKEIMKYDPNNRKIVFLPFIKMTPANSDIINDQRDAFRRDKFLFMLLLSLSENGKDVFDDDKWYADFKMWLKPRNAEHTIAEKYSDCLIKLYAGKRITAQSLYDAYVSFQSSVAKFNDDGKKLSPLAQNKFHSSPVGFSVEG